MFFQKSIFFQKTTDYFKYNKKPIFVVFFFYPTRLICFSQYINVNRCLFLKFLRNVLWTFSKRAEKMLVGWRPWDVPSASILNLSYKLIFTALFSILFHQMCAWKAYQSAVIIVIGFWRNVLNTSYNYPKVTSGCWRPLEILTTSILNISTKHISVPIFSTLFHQMCLLGNRKFVIVYSFSFRETCYELPKSVSK